MKVELYKQYRFEAAHRLPCVEETHRCRHLHGHSYRVELGLRGEVDPARGWLVDFGRIDEVFAPIAARLDHQCLNDVPGLENPTAEHLAVWLWRELRPALPELVAVSVYETPDARCTYRGD